jgi:PAS domain S-box-containing protein
MEISIFVKPQKAGVGETPSPSYIGLRRVPHEVAHDLSDVQLRRLLEANVIGVIISSSSGAISEANDAYLGMIGYTRDQLSTGAINWRSLTPPEWTASDDNAVVQLAENGIVTPYEKEYVHKDGDRVRVSLSGTRILGTTDLKICSIVDLSTVRRAKASREADPESPNADWINPQAAFFASKQRFGLTNREHEVLSALLQGLTNAEIAAGLCISTPTVSDHVQSVMRKVQVQKRGQLFRRVILE